MCIGWVPRAQQWMLLNKEKNKWSLLAKRPKVISKRLLGQDGPKTFPVAIPAMYIYTKIYMHCHEQSKKMLLGQEQVYLDKAKSQRRDWRYNYTFDVIFASFLSTKWRESRISSQRKKGFNCNNAVESVVFYWLLKPKYAYFLKSKFFSCMLVPSFSLHAKSLSWSDIIFSCASCY